MLRRHLLPALAALAVLPWPGAATAQGRSITVASTASAGQSGLSGHILPLLTREPGIGIRVVALGPGRRPMSAGAAMQYGVMPVAAIASCRINGEQPFFPNLAQPEPAS